MIFNKLFFWALASFCLLEIKAERDELYEVKADVLMDNMLDGVYKGYLKRNRNSRGRSAMSSTSDPLPTRAILPATQKIIHKEEEEHVTKEEFNIRKRKREAKSLLEYEINPSPNFQESVDEIAIQTRRFDELTRMPYQESARRELYSDLENKTLVAGEKNKTIDLMQQFIYETHYMMPYMQVARKKYITNLRYRLGYCFALLRNLKKQQMMIYSTFKNYYDLIMTVYAHLKFYQKIVRLDVDIKDLLRLMYALDIKIRTEVRVGNQDDNDQYD